MVAELSTIEIYMFNEISASQRELSSKLEDFILNKIRRDGPITFCQYMDMALYHHSYGYYRNGSSKFGSGGDFVTSPEISSHFSHCIAKQFSVVSSTNPNYCVLELGAGSGKMACDILLALDQIDQLPATYYILDVSSELAVRQREFITERAPSLVSKVKWISEWPTDMHGVILANEVLDAMPVNKFGWNNDFYECYVGVNQSKLSWEHGALSSPQLEQALSNLNIPEIPYYESEINLSVTGWVESLSRCLASGVIF